MRRMIVVVALLLVGAVGAIAQQPQPAQPAAPTKEANPFFEAWTAPFELPPFERIRNEHFLPAFDRAIAQRRQEVEAIALSSEPASFANTVEPLNEGGLLLQKVMGVFFSLASANTNETLQKVQAEVMPKLAALRDDVALDPRLFARVKKVWDERDKIDLDSEQRKLLEETYKGFVRGGANLTSEKQARFREINKELSSLSTTFSQNVLAETNAFKLVVEKQEDLAGLSPQAVAAAAETAKRAGLEGKWVFTLQPSSLRPFVAYADNRELRRQLFTAYKLRADNGNESDNNRIAARMATLRAERVQMLGYKTFADFQIEEYMAKTPANVYALMNKLWAPAVAKADEDAKLFQAMLAEKHPEAQIQPYDWGYYAEKVKKARYDFDEETLRPYFSLDRVREGAFGVATRLYGLTFTARPDLPRYHPDVEVFEVKEADGTHVGVLILDFFPRPGKRGGAWSGSLRQAGMRDGKDIRPIVTNVASFTPPTGDTPALLSRGEVETLFHEFGHALHSLLTRVRYSALGDVPWDFVELPSQIMEHWVLEPEVVKSYARHYKTGEVLPDDLIARIKKAKTFNQGYATVGMVSTVLLDLDWHTLSEIKEIDARAFEKASFERMGLPRYATSYHRTPAFSHIFAGGYAAGYYSYLWSEVLDNDAFEAFKEKGIFDKATATAFRKHILERAGTGDVAEAYRRFRGKDPAVEPLLRSRGLLPEAVEAKPAKAN